MEYTFYPPHPFMVRRKLKHMKDFTFAIPTEENHNISQFMEPHRGQNWNLVVSQGCVPEYILLFGLRSLQLKIQFSLNVTSILDLSNILGFVKHKVLNVYLLWSDMQITWVS